MHPIARLEDFFPIRPWTVKEVSLLSLASQPGAAITAIMADVLVSRSDGRLPAGILGEMPIDMLPALSEACNRQTVGTDLFREAHPEGPPAQKALAAPEEPTTQALSPTWLEGIDLGEYGKGESSDG